MINVYHIQHVQTNDYISLFISDTGESGDGPEFHNPGMYPHMVPEAGISGRDKELHLTEYCGMQ